MLECKYITFTFTFTLASTYAFTHTQQAPVYVYVQVRLCRIGVCHTGDPPQNQRGAPTQRELAGEGQERPASTSPTSQGEAN